MTAAQSSSVACDIDLVIKTLPAMSGEDIARLVPHTYAGPASGDKYAPAVAALITALKCTPPASSEAVVARAKVAVVLHWLYYTDAALNSIAEEVVARFYRVINTRACEVCVLSALCAEGDCDE